MLTISHNRFLLKTIPSLLFQKQLHHGAAFFALSFETKGFQQGDNKHLNYTQIAHTSYVELISDIWFGKWQEIIEQTQTLFFPTMAHLKKKKKTKQNNKPLSFPTKHQNKLTTSQLNEKNIYKISCLYELLLSLTKGK